MNDTASFDAAAPPGILAKATVEDAWAAARMAAVDKEIAAMPMGMLTCVGASASVTSGGESERIVIAHRLSTLRQADRIFVMQSGKVVQEGTFAELAETEGVFRDLVRRQVA